MNKDFKRYDLTIVALVYVLVNGSLFYWHGIKIVNDSHRYMEYATNLQHGFYIDPYNFWYLGYSLYVLLINFFHGTATAIVLGQYLLGFLATLALYHTSVTIWQDRRSALLTVLLYILFIDVSSWNSYVLTESLYASFTCFSLCALALIFRGKRDIWFIALACMLTLFTILIKPTGIALLGAVLVTLISMVLKENRNWKVVGAIVFFAGIAFLMLVNRMLSNYQVMENYRMGEVIYGVTTVKGNFDVQSLIISPPANIYSPPKSYPALVKIIIFIVHHPVYWTTLFLAKAYSLLSNVRPFWSTTHNLLSLFVLVPCYALFIYVFTMQKVMQLIAVFAITFVFLHVLSVSITSNDWDGRFLIPILPVVFIVAGFGAMRLWSKAVQPILEKKQK